MKCSAMRFDYGDNLALLRENFFTPSRRRESRRGKTRAWHQACLQQLHHKVLRSQQAPDRLSEVCDCVRAAGTRPRTTTASDVSTARG